MRQFRLLGILAAVIVVLSSFYYKGSSSSSSDWYLGHFKATVDLGEGDRPIYIHAVNTTDPIKTIQDNPNGIGCEDSWNILSADANEVVIEKTTTGSCIPVGTIVLENVSEGIMTGSFYDQYPGTPIAAGDFIRYATIPE